MENPELIVTFENPNTGAKIVLKMSEDSNENLDVNVGFNQKAKKTIKDHDELMTIIFARLIN